MNCTSLESVTIPENVVTFGDRVFSGCTSLKTVKMNSDIVSMPTNMFSGCTSLEELTLNDKIAEFSYGWLLAIPDYAFTNCPNLRYVTIPESVVLIQPNAFDRENVTVRCYQDSFAHSYALENNISFELLKKIVLGDVNNDGAVNINDVTDIQRNLAELEEFDEYQQLAADANQDGALDISDATAIQMYLADYKLPYPIGQILK